MSSSSNDQWRQNVCVVPATTIVKGSKQMCVTENINGVDNTGHVCFYQNVLCKPENMLVSTHGHCIHDGNVKCINK